MQDLGKPIVIWGTETTGQEVWRELSFGNGGDAVASCVDRKFISESAQNRLPVVPHENLVNDFPPDKYRIIVGLGYSDYGLFRIRRFEELQNLGYEFATCISHWAVTSESVNPGEGSVISANTCLHSTLSVCRNVFVGASCTIPHDCEIGDHCYFSCGVTLSGEVNIGRGVFIGTGAVVRNGIDIGENA